MFGETPTVNQRFPSPSRLSMRTRVTASVPPVRMRTLKSTQLEVVDEALVAAEILAERIVERIHRAVAFADRQHRLAVDAHLHRRLRHGDEVAHGIVPALDHHPKRFHLEELRHIAEEPPRQQLEGGVRGLIGIALGLALLHRVEQSGRYADRPWARRCRCAQARQECWSGRPGPTRAACAGCRPTPAARARRCAGPSARRRHAARLVGEGRVADVRRHAGSAPGSGSRRGGARRA